jgi:DNA-binding response OmpR family regulator
MIVDRSAESRDVLRTLLERRGAVAIEAPRAEDAVQVAELHQPDLIVLDAESDRSAGGRNTVDLRAAAGRSATPIVILGSLGPHRSGISAGEFVAKPYHYGSLIRKIEELLKAA